MMGDPENQQKYHVKLNAKNPSFLYVANAPLKLGGQPEMKSIEEIEKKFQYQHLETVVCRDEFNPIDYTQWDSDYSDPVFVELFQKVRDRIQNPLNEKLVICHINDEVGYGVFAKEHIDAGTVVGIYAGEIEGRDDEDKEYGMSLHAGNSPFRVNTRSIGGLMRFVQHMPHSLKFVRKAMISNKNNVEKLIAIIDGNGQLFSEEDKQRVRGFSGKQVDQFINNQLTRIKAVVDPLLEEERTKYFLQNNSEKIAFANLLQGFASLDGIPVIYLKTCVDIEPGAQLGISYGLPY